MSDAAPDGTRKSQIKNRKSRNWLWFFVALAVMGTTAIAVNWVYNRRQQLSRDQVDAARKLWEEKGPRDYDLEYTLKGSVNGTYTVKVRDGKVVSAEPDDRPIKVKRHYYGMPALFDFIDEFLLEDAQPGSARAYNLANFDPADGHLSRYVRSVSRRNYRLEIQVERFERVVLDDTAPIRKD